MRLIPVWALRPGMEVARKVAFGSSAPLLKVGVKLQSEYIQQLKKMGVKAIYVHDNLIPDILVEDVILEETREKAISLVRSTLSEINDLEKMKYSRMLSKQKDLTSVIDDIMGQLLGNNNLTVNLADIRNTDDYTFSHSVNVAILSLMTSISLGLGKTDMQNLGLGVFLHDLGKVLVPLAILNKPGRLEEGEMEEIRKHPAYGLDLVKTRRFINGPSLSIIYKHHERIDGSGYPQGLVGEGIELFPKICAVTDVYDALVSDRPYRPGFKPYRAMEIMEEECTGYDLQVIQTFFHHVAAFPVGSFVALNSGYIGVVVRNTYGHPTRPKVRVFCSREDFEPLEKFEVDLTETLNVVVDRVYDDHEIPESFYYQGLPD